MTERLLLIVEDNEGQLDLLKDAVAEENAKGGDTFRIEPVGSAKEATMALKELKPDCAIIDLRIPTSRKVPAKRPLGIKIALAAIKENGIPVALVSGNMGEIEDSLDAFPMIGRFDKDDPLAFEKALLWIQEQGSMMTALTHAREKIQKSVAETFSERIWGHWAEYKEATDSDQILLDDIVTRQIVSHVAEILGLDDENNPDWHPFESYIRPGLHADRAQTGDIFELDDEIWIVLTPQCDMATGKVDNIILAKCEHGKVDGWDQKILDLKAGDEAQKEKIRKFIRKRTNQDLPVSQHFIPPLDNRGPMLVAFTVLNTISKDDLEQVLHKRIASLAATFTPNLTQRFGAYISRPGQPNLDPDLF